MRHYSQGKRNSTAPFTQTRSTYTNKTNAELPIRRSPIIAHENPSRNPLGIQKRLSQISNGRVLPRQFNITEPLEQMRNLNTHDFQSDPIDEQEQYERNVEVPIRQAPISTNENPHHRPTGVQRRSSQQMPNQSHTRVFGRDILHHTPRINQNFRNDQINEEEQFDEHDDDIDATNLQVNEELHRKTTQVRGPTRMYRVWNGKNHNLMEVPLNELGQPCGDNATSFSNFLGTIVRNLEHAPLNYIDWRHMPQHFKERMWGTVKLNCNVNDEHKDWVMKTLHKNWKEFKCELRRKHYDVHDNDEDRLADRDPRVLPEQWEFLVEFFGSEKGQERSQRNKNNRAKQVTTHTTGSKSFARVREEARKELNVTPNRAELFKLTHVRKNGVPINEDVAEKIREIDELTIQQPDLAKKNIKGDLFSHVFGEDRRGHVRGLGLGPTHSNIWGGKPSRSDYARISNEKITHTW